MEASLHPRGWSVRPMSGRPAVSRVSGMTITSSSPDLRKAPDETPAVDPQAVEAFVGRVLTDFAGAAGTAMTLIGDRLGLYQAMTGAGPVTAAELAYRSGLNVRLVAEWLSAQTVSGYVTYQPATGRFELPIEHAMAL